MCLIDRYTIFVHVLGHLLHLIWGTEQIDIWIFGFMGALGLELVLWEVIGNAPFVKKKIRDEAGGYGVNISRSLGW